MTRTLAIALLAAAGVQLVPSERAPRPDVRGAALGLFASESGYDYEAMVEEIADRGATDVLLVDRWMQRDLHASELRRAEGSSPSVATVARTIRQARAHGLRVSLMPIVGLERRRPGEWRGRIEPADLDGWFARYGEHLDELASVAEREGVRRLIVGSELNALERHDGRWRERIAGVRERYRGPLLYSANWDRYERVTFWDALDAIGVSAYFRVDGPEGAPAIWARQLRRLERFAGGRELVITEVGYPARPDAARFPWDDSRSGPVDTRLQADLLGAFCEAYAQRPGAGYFVWNWFGVGGPRDGGYSLRGKPGAARFERCMEE